MEDLPASAARSRLPRPRQAGAGNLTVCGRYGKDKQHRLLYCRTCKARFSERKGTPLFGSQLPAEKALALRAPRRAQRRPGHRPAGRREPQHRGPLQPAAGRARPASSTTSSWLFPPRTREVQFDEKWSFVFKKQEHCDPDRPGRRPARGLLGPRGLRPRAPAGPRRRARGTRRRGRRGGGRRGPPADRGPSMRLMTSDDYPAYEAAILHAYGEAVEDDADGPARPADGPGEGAAAGADLRHGREAAGEGPGGGDPGAPGLRDDGGGGRRPWGGRG